MFVGRKSEIALLEDLYSSRKSELVVIYGRRRIGKSALIHQFIQGHKTAVFHHEGIEGENTKAQVNYFTESLLKQTRNSVLASVSFKNWNRALQYLTDNVIKNKKSSKKTIIVFDEIQWMAAYCQQRSTFAYN